MPDKLVANPVPWTPEKEAQSKLDVVAWAGRNSKSNMQFTKESVLGTIRVDVRLPDDHPTMTALYELHEEKKFKDYPALVSFFEDLGYEGFPEHNMPDYLREDYEGEELSPERIKELDEILKDDYSEDEKGHDFSESLEKLDKKIQENIDSSDDNSEEVSPEIPEESVVNKEAEDNLAQDTSSVKTDDSTEVSVEKDADESSNENAATDNIRPEFTVENLKEDLKAAEKIQNGEIPEYYFEDENKSNNDENESLTETTGVDENSNIENSDDENHAVDISADKDKNGDDIVNDSDTNAESDLESDPDSSEDNKDENGMYIDINEEVLDIKQETAYRKHKDKKDEKQKSIDDYNDKKEVANKDQVEGHQEYSATLTALSNIFRGAKNIIASGANSWHEKSETKKYNKFAENKVGQLDKSKKLVLIGIDAIETGKKPNGKPLPASEREKILKNLPTLIHDYSNRIMEATEQIGDKEISVHAKRSLVNSIKESNNVLKKIDDASDPDMKEVKDQSKKMLKAISNLLKKLFGRPENENESSNTGP